MDEEEILNDLLSWSSVSPHAAFPGPDVVPGPVPGTQTLPHIFPVHQQNLWKISHKCFYSVRATLIRVFVQQYNGGIVHRYIYDRNNGSRQPESQVHTMW